MLHASELTMNRAPSLISKNSLKKRFYCRAKMHRAFIIQGKKKKKKSYLGLQLVYHIPVRGLEKSGKLFRQGDTRRDSEGCVNVRQGGDQSSPCMS